MEKKEASRRKEKEKERSKREETWRKDRETREERVAGRMQRAMAGPTAAVF